MTDSPAVVASAGDLRHNGGLLRAPYKRVPERALNASVVKLVDAPDSKSGSERSAGSIPARGTTPEIQALSPALTRLGFLLSGGHGTLAGHSARANDNHRPQPRYYLHSPIIGDLASQARHDSRQKRKGRENPVDTFMNLLAQDCDEAYNQSVVNTTLAAGAKPADIHRSILESFREFGVSAGATPDLGDVALPRGRVMVSDSDPRQRTNPRCAIGAAISAGAR